VNPIFCKFYASPRFSGALPATERLERFPNSKSLMIETDCGGSNSAVSRAWKYHLQEKVSDRFGLSVTVCHYPTGASKWNPIEHRLFSEISKTWAGCSLRTFAIAAQYIRGWWLGRSDL